LQFEKQVIILDNFGLDPELHRRLVQPSHVRAAWVEIEKLEVRVLGGLLVHRPQTAFEDGRAHHDFFGNLTNIYRLYDQQAGQSFTILPFVYFQAHLRFQSNG
jgi:hypothetical protein